uniref:FlbA n=1 Tax=Monascus ruber TaxID=89489 RepID=B4XTT4_MONRU|nr:FlbA [Monascus ruber]
MTTSKLYSDRGGDLPRPHPFPDPISPPPPALLHRDPTSSPASLTSALSFSAVCHHYHNHNNHHPVYPATADADADVDPDNTITTNTNTFQGSIIGSISRASRRSLASLGRDKKANAFTNLSSSASIRSTPSISNLATHAHKPSQYSVGDIASVTPPLSDSSATSDPFSSTEDYYPSSRPSTPPVSEYQLNLADRRRHLSNLSQSASPGLSSVSKPGLVSGRLPRKMHQTSSRLLRMTEDERPFTKDFMDLFSTLMVSLKLESHRVRFTRYDHSFTAEEAISNLGSLRFSQSNRMPDPKDPSRIVTTTTTTTFSMAKEMARSVCQRFVDARFIEPVDGKPLAVFPLKGSLFQLTPKGINILQRFCQRNGITARHIIEVLDSPRNTMQLVNLERDSETDKLSHDRATIEVIFRRFAGQDGPNVKNSISSSDSDSLNDYSNGIVGVKVAKDRRIRDRVFHNTFTGKAAVDWLMDCSTTIERRETCLIAELFVKYGLITMLQEDRLYQQPETSMTVFQPTKNAIYGITERGQQVCGWIAREKGRDFPGTSLDSRGIPRDSNNARLNHILQDPALRLLFREFLRYSLCEENLAFYIDVSEFTSNYHKAEKLGAFTRIDAVRETLAAAYGLYNAFLAPGSPCELNIEHALRNSLASRMTKAVGDDESMLRSLQEVVELFEMAQTSVFKLMSSDSVPKFLRDPKYAVVLQEHNVDILGTSRSYSPTSTRPERSKSRSITKG